MSRSTVRCASPMAIRPLAFCIALALSASAQAATVQASASYSLDGGPVVSFVAGPNGNSVDVLEFPYGSNYESSAGIHTYGDVSGSFGSRSSGYGVYDVTGLFVITTTVKNMSDAAQRATFNFEVTPGTLANYVLSNLAAGESVSAGLTFDIRANGNQVWGSSASLSTNSSGTTYQQTGTNIYTPAAGSGTPTAYSVDGGRFSVDLGVLNAGESLSLSYALSTFAKGQAPGHPGEIFTVPDQEITVPERTFYYPGYSYQSWVYDGNTGGDVVATAAVIGEEILEGYGGGYGEGYGGGYGGGYGEGYEQCGGGSFLTGSGSCQTFSVPAYTAVLPAYSYTIYGGAYKGQPSGSMASSGDPFDIDFNGGNGYTNANVTFTTAVPEPSTYVLMFACLGLIGATVRKRTA
jgi:PEP-CTERM motif